MKNRGLLPRMGIHEDESEADPGINLRTDRRPLTADFQRPQKVRGDPEPPNGSMVRGVCGIVGMLGSSQIPATGAPERERRVKGKKQNSTKNQQEFSETGCIAGVGGHRRAEGLVHGGLLGGTAPGMRCRPVGGARPEPAGSIRPPTSQTPGRAEQSGAARDRPWKELLQSCPKIG